VGDHSGAIAREDENLVREFTLSSWGGQQKMGKRTKEAKTKKIESVLAGIAGECFVAAELSRRGYIATLTQRNTMGVDVLLRAKSGAQMAAVQVKTNQNNGQKWVLSSKAQEFLEKSLFYVFVNLNGTGSPEFHIVPSVDVAEQIKREHSLWLRTPGRKGQSRNDNAVRNFKISDQRYRDRWDILQLK
jgi:hypothetical protein